MPSAAEIEAWFIAELSAALRLTPAMIDPARSFEEYGVDSIVGAQLAEKLERWLDRSLDPAMLWDYPTIRSLSEALAVGAG